MIGKERRDRSRRDYSPRSEGRNTSPPSRHLWIGNLSHHVHESELTEQCLRFGELDSICFLPGRSYAFVNYRKEEDAILAMRALQGFVLSGLALKIEFAKAEKSLPSSHDEYPHRRDERRSLERGTPFQRDSRARPTSPEMLYSDRSRMGDKNAEPSEVLWIGFPSFLNVDEVTLRKSFSPYGEIEKITAFPGRSYAFVQFRSVAAACRAKEALQGRLFNNPRVSICFAKSEMNPHEQGRNSMNPPFSPPYKSNGHLGRSMEFRQDRNFGSPAGEPYRNSPRFNSDWESSDSDVRKAPAWTGGRGPFEPMGLQGARTHLGLSEDVYERRSSPARERGPQRREFSPGRLPRKSLFSDHPSGMQDTYVFREAKKLKTGPFPPDQELPEYPFSDSAPDNQHSGLSMTFPNLPEHGAFDRSFGSGDFSYNKIGDRPMNLPLPPNERNDNWNAPFDRFETGSGSLQTNPVKWRISTPEPHQSPVKEEWKWEGTIAKGGTPVCRARCFPVGKVADVMLPGFLDCTARTSLDMLAKHFYQAASAWVVFFVPESDPDIALYNEFMHYLGEKQRAAVAKLGEKTTLFLVPPSEFSEKVLKVPGKLSISGVILRFQDLGSDFGSHNQRVEAMDSKLPSFNGAVPHSKPPPSDTGPFAWGPSQTSNLSSQPFPSLTSFGNSRKSELDDLPFMGNIPGPVLSGSGSTHLTGRVSEAPIDSRYFQMLQNQHSQPNWSPHHMQNANPGSGNLPPQASASAGVDSSDAFTKERHYQKAGTVQETNSSPFSPVISDAPPAGSSRFSHHDTKPQVPLSEPIPSLQPEQLAHLASLLVQRQHSGSDPAFSQEEGQKQSFQANQSNNPLQHHASSAAATFQFGQLQQLQQNSNAAAVSQQMGTPQAQVSQQPQNHEEGNPHTRLQATLQLAATLLQQIQQQAKGADQR